MFVTESEIDAFGHFAKEQIGAGGVGVSFQQILDKWQAKREAEAVADDIRQGIADIEAGKGKPVAQAFADVREKLGLPE